MQIASGKRARIARGIMQGCARADFDGHQQKVHSEIGSTVRVCVPQPTEWQRIGNQIDAAMIFARSDFVSVDAHKQPDVPLKG
jgi:hypothetical protein